MKPKVYITRRIPAAGPDLLRSSCEVEIWDDDDVIPREILLAGSRGADALLCLLTDRVDGELLEAAPRLKVIGAMSVGYDNVDLAACSRRRIPVGNTPGVLTETTADLTWALLLACARRLVEGADFVKAGRWTTWGPLLMLGPDIHGATLGVIGMGRIGSAVARRARGFGMRILYHDPACRGDAGRETGAECVPLDKLLRESDFISIHATLGSSSRGMIGTEAFALMKPTAVLVNVARGPIVDTEALTEALSAGRIFAAALNPCRPITLCSPCPIAWSFPISEAPASPPGPGWPSWPRKTSWRVWPAVGSLTASTRTYMRSETFRAGRSRRGRTADCRWTRRDVSSPSVPVPEMSGRHSR
jgi:glyoxylate reductase